MDVIEEMLGGHSDSQTFDISKERMVIIRNSGPRGRWVSRIGAGDRLEHVRDIADGSGHRPRVIQRPTERSHAEPTDSSIRRLQTHDAATFRGTADGASRVASHGE